MAGMSAGKSIDDATIEKKFANAKNTQESIQSIALWAIHHKSQHSKVVELWLEVMKKSKPPRRITLFYICNEIVQTCKRKRATPYKESFQLVLLEATALVRDAAVRSNIERIFTIWQSRGVFESEYVDELMAALTQTGNSSKSRSSSATTTTTTTTTTKVKSETQSTAATVTAVAATNILEEFKPSVLRELVAQVAQCEKDLELKRRRLNVHSIDELSQKLSKHTKDRNHSKLYSQQVEDIHKNLTDYISSVESEMVDRQRMVELLEQSELFYEVQYGEAKIVANAYKNFGTRISNLRKRLEDVKKTLPDPLSPIPSPTLDAPSPGDSPVDNTIDNTDAVDMELSDDHEEAYSPGSADKSTAVMTLLAEHTIENKDIIPVTDVSPIVFSIEGVDVPTTNVVTPISTISSMPTIAETTASTAAQTAVQIGLDKLSANSDMVLSLLSSLKSHPLMTEKHENFETSVTVKQEIVVSSHLVETLKSVSSDRVSLEPTQTLVALINPTSVVSDTTNVFNSMNEVAFESPTSMDYGKKQDDPRISIYRSPNAFGNVPAVTSTSMKHDHATTSTYGASQPMDNVIQDLTSVDIPVVTETSGRIQQESALSPTYMDIADDDEGGLTPVMDEKPETAEIPMSPPRAPSMTTILPTLRPAVTAESTVVSQAARVTDPIAFLNQMLSQSKPKQTGSSSSFFQSLSMLTKGFPNNQVSSADENDVYVGGYVDTDEQRNVMSSFSDTAQLKIVPVVPAVGSPPSIDGSLLPPPLPSSSSSAMPAPPVPQMIVSSAPTPGELLPPPLPPSLYGFSKVALTQYNSTHSITQSLPAQFIPSSLMQSHVMPGAPHSSHVTPGMVLVPDPAQSAPVASGLPSISHHASITGSDIIYGDTIQLQVQQLIAPPPPPPPPLYPDTAPLPSVHPDWPGASPRMLNATMSITGRPSGPQSAVSPSDYNRHQRPALAMSCDPVHPGYDFGSTGDGHEYNERLKRSSMLQFPPGEHMHNDDTRVAPNMYSDRHVQGYADYGRGNDNANIFPNVNPHNLNMRPRGDLESHRNIDPPWSGERNIHHAHRPGSPPSSPQGAIYRPERLQDFQHQPRPGRLPPPSAFSGVRGMPPGRFPRGHPARY